MKLILGYEATRNFTTPACVDARRGTNGLLSGVGILDNRTKGQFVAKAFLIFVLLGVGLAACSSTTHPPIESAGSGNFHLYVSNQSFDIPKVDIQVYIDDEQVVDDAFKVESQHTWVLFDLDLVEGEHELRAVALDGETELVETIAISDQHWGLVQFWADPNEAPTPRFTFDIQDEPIYFA